MTNQPQPTWLSFDYDDREANPLPPAGEVVWINERYYHGVAPGYWDGDGWCLWTGSDDVSVSHWQPLEKPDAPSGVG